MRSAKLETLHENVDGALAGSRLVLQVVLEGPGGERWTAVGGGETLDQALHFAHVSAPSGTLWQVASWNDLYGD